MLRRTCRHALVPVASLPGLIAGFDAGQTHTTCRLAEAGSGRVLAEGQGPGVSHLAAPEGAVRFQAALTGSLAEARRCLVASQARPAAGEPAPPAGWAAAQNLEEGSWRVAAAPTAAMGPRAAGRLASSEQPLPLPVAASCATPERRLDVPLLAAAIGASGIESGTGVQRQGLELASACLGLPQERLWVGGDERTALRGAFPDGPGIVVISGTGTIAVGRNGGAAAEGREHRCAGWGWILDGAGSAFDIGRDGLALSLQMADGRLREGPLRPALWRALELDPADPLAPQAIKALVVRAGFTPAGLAGLAPVVEALASQGDPQAEAILRRHAEALVSSVVGVAEALRLSGPPVATLGGAIRQLRCFEGLFREALHQALPAASLVTPAGDAVSGALSLARERLVGL
jgi:phenylacetic acid degradation operon negative regulatory protein